MNPFDPALRFAEGMTLIGMRLTLGDRRVARMSRLMSERQQARMAQRHPKQAGKIAEAALEEVREEMEADGDE